MLTMSAIPGKQLRVATALSAFRQIGSGEEMVWDGTAADLAVPDAPTSMFLSSASAEDTVPVPKIASFKLSGGIDPSTHGIWTSTIGGPVDAGDVARYAIATKTFDLFVLAGDDEASIAARFAAAAMNGSKAAVVSTLAGPFVEHDSVRLTLLSLDGGTETHFDMSLAGGETSDQVLSSLVAQVAASNGGAGHPVWTAAAFATGQVFLERRTVGPIVGAAPALSVLVGDATVGNRTANGSLRQTAYAVESDGADVVATTLVFGEFDAGPVSSYTFDPGGSIPAVKDGYSISAAGVPDAGDTLRVSIDAVNYDHIYDAGARDIWSSVIVTGLIGDVFSLTVKGVTQTQAHRDAQAKVQSIVLSGTPSAGSAKQVPVQILAGPYNPGTPGGPGIFMATTTDGGARVFQYACMGPATATDVATGLKNAINNGTTDFVGLIIGGTVGSGDAPTIDIAGDANTPYSFTGVATKQAMAEGLAAAIQGDATATYGAVAMDVSDDMSGVWAVLLSAKTIGAAGAHVVTGTGNGGTSFMQLHIISAVNASALWTAGSVTDTVTFTRSAAGATADTVAMSDNGAVPGAWSSAGTVVDGTDASAAWVQDGDNDFTFVYVSGGLAALATGLAGQINGAVPDVGGFYVAAVDGTNPNKVNVSTATPEDFALTGVPNGGITPTVTTPTPYAAADDASSIADALIAKFTPSGYTLGNVAGTITSTSTVDGVAGALGVVSGKTGMTGSFDSTNDVPAADAETANVIAADLAGQINGSDPTYDATNAVFPLVLRAKVAGATASVVAVSVIGAGSASLMPTHDQIGVDASGTPSTFVTVHTLIGDIHVDRFGFGDGTLHWTHVVVSGDSLTSIAADLAAQCAADGYGLTRDGSDPTKWFVQGEPAVDFTLIDESVEGIGEGTSVACTIADVQAAVVGTGIRQVQMRYVDSTGATRTIIVDLNGTAAVETEQNDIVRIVDLVAVETGSGGKAAAAIKVADVAGTTIYAGIPANKLAMDSAQLYVPEGHEMVIVDISATNGSDTAGRLRLRSNTNPATMEVTDSETGYIWGDFQVGADSLAYHSTVGLGPFKAGSRVWTTGEGNGAKLGVNLSGYLQPST